METMGRTFGFGVRIISYGFVLALAPCIGLAAQTSPATRVSDAAKIPQQSRTDGSYRVLYAFKGGKLDGAYPVSALTEVNGTFYGTTYRGGPNPGPNNLPDGSGTVFKISPSGAEGVLHAFGNGSDGAYPLAALLDLNGVLYGTTYGGGSSKFSVEGAPTGGTVFSIETGGNERVLHSFPDRDGDGISPGNYNTSTGPLVYANGVLYGVTATSRLNQVYGSGTVFEITTRGAERVLYHFKNSPALDAYIPIDLIDVNGVGYGTSLFDTSTAGGGGGTVYEFGRAGERVLYTFKGAPDGRLPNGGLIFGNGVLYGTTSNGGAYDRGAVFSFKGSTENVLHSFKGKPDGENPKAGLIVVNGVGYGTTTGGGAYNNGTIFKITASGNETVLHSFRGGTDGANPSSGLTYFSGSLYGTAQNGGNGGCVSGCGAVFKLTL